jgi:CRP/FNR family transcriptional regulator, anaerobic regulatory protein
MEKTPQRIYCTDTTWQGRADCRHCNIRHLMMFSGLPESAFDDILSPIDNYCYPGGTVLFDEGKCDRGIFSIRRGIIKMQSLTTDGTQHIVRLLGAGSAIGLELLASEKCYRHTAIALTTVDACQIPLETMLQLDATYPQLCQQVRARLQEDLDRTDRWVIILSSGAARTRVAHLLLLILEYSSIPDHSIDLPGLRDIAAIIGTSVETASRIIADLKRRGILHKTGAHCYQCDVAALEAITRETG